MNNMNLETVSLSKNELSRYARHLSLSEIGLNGQKKLKSSSVLCIGCGGLGSPLLLYLAAAGIGKLGIADNDFVEDSNLQRQIIHGVSRIGNLKSHSAKIQIKEINPYCEVETFPQSIKSTNALELIKDFDLVCDCTDNFPSRYLINDACVILKKPLVYGSVDRFIGQASVFNLNKNSPNYRDLLPEPPDIKMIPSCEESGVLGVIPGVIGLIQATESIKIITGVGDVLDGKLLIFDAKGMNFKKLTLNKNNDTKKIKSLIDYDQFCARNKNRDNNEFKPDIISPEALILKEKNNPEDTIIIDVRTKEEAQISSIRNSILIPLIDIEREEAINRIKEISQGKSLYIYCKSGKRSIKALRKLHEFGIEGINIEGGIEAWDKFKKSNQ